MLKGKLKYVQGLYLSSRNKYGFSQNKTKCGEGKKKMYMIKHEAERSTEIIE